MEATYLVECFWPGLTRDSVEAADRRVSERVRQLRADGARLQYLGSVVVPQDDVVFFEFEGTTHEQVSDAASDVGIAFERVVESVRVPHHRRLGPDGTGSRKEER